MTEILLRHQPLRHSRSNSESTKRYCPATRTPSSSILLHTYVFVKYYYFGFNENDNACLILERGYWAHLGQLPLRGPDLGTGQFRHIGDSLSWINCLAEFETRWHPKMLIDTKLVEDAKDLTLASVIFQL
jgi:hypothetical protein